MPRKKREPEQPFDVAELMARECTSKSPDDLQHIRLAVGFSKIVGDMIEKALEDYRASLPPIWSSPEILYGAVRSVADQAIDEHEACWHAEKVQISEVLGQIQKELARLIDQQGATDVAQS